MMTCVQPTRGMDKDDPIYEGLGKEDLDKMREEMLGLRECGQDEINERENEINELRGIPEIDAILDSITKLEDEIDEFFGRMVKEDKQLMLELIEENCVTILEKIHALKKMLGMVRNQDPGKYSKLAKFVEAMLSEYDPQVKIDALHNQIQELREQREILQEKYTQTIKREINKARGTRDNGSVEEIQKELRSITKKIYECRCELQELENDPKYITQKLNQLSLRKQDLDKEFQKIKEKTGKRESAEAARERREAFENILVKEQSQLHNERFEELKKLASVKKQKEVVAELNQAVHERIIIVEN